MNRILPIYLILLLSLFFCSCASSKKFALLQDVSDDNNEKMADFQAKLQPDDVLMIIISTDNPLISQPYNLMNVNMSGGGDSSSSSGQQRQMTYQIDQQGNIVMPNLGVVNAAGKTRNQLISTIRELLENKISNPTITVRIMNFKVSVQGEVKSPGTFPINSERVTLLEALSMAGDLTIYGKRNNILVIREENGVKSFQKVDITKGDFINSPYYYLSQNDMIYVEPNKTKVNSSVIGPNIGVAFSAISLIITIVVLTTK